jgi:hypothetical protein
MHKTTLIGCLLFITLASGPILRAQDNPRPQAPPTAKEMAPAPPVHFYHLHFVFEELDPEGKPVNSRAFDLTASTARDFRGRIASGSRIPIITGAFHTPSESNAPDTQYQYLDIGVHFQTYILHETDGQLAFNLEADVTSLAGTPASNNGDPVIRQNQWGGQVLIPIGKPTVVFSSDSLESKGSMQVVVTATPLP